MEAVHWGGGGEWRRLAGVREEDRAPAGAPAREEGTLPVAVKTRKQIHAHTWLNTTTETSVVRNAAPVALRPQPQYTMATIAPVLSVLEAVARIPNCETKGAASAWRVRRRETGPHGPRAPPHDPLCSVPSGCVRAKLHGSCPPPHKTGALNGIQMAMTRRVGPHARPPAGLG